MASAAHPPRRFDPPSELPPDVLARSVAELAGLDVPRGAYELGSQAWLARALVSPLGELGASDLRLLLAHERGVAWVLPLALAWLARDPLAGGDRGAGELLGGVLIVDGGVWDAHPDWRDRLAAVVACARASVPSLPEPARTSLADDLDAARDLLGV